MELISKSKALNTLIPELINQSDVYTKELKKRLRLNKIFSEFENKASNQLNYFINESNHRYNGTKLGNSLETLILNSRYKNNSHANKILKDRFYTDCEIENERQKMKYKSSAKAYAEIQNTLIKMKLPLEDGNVGEMNQIYNSVNQSRNHLDSNEKEKKKYINVNKENVVGDKNAIKIIVDRDQNYINRNIDSYLDEVKSIKLEQSNEGFPPIKKKIDIDLPLIKFINYRQYRPPKKPKGYEEELKKVNIGKLLPYSSLGKSTYEKQNNSQEEKEKENEINCFPFITETNYHLIKKDQFHNTANVVAETASREINIRDSLEQKRKKLEEILGLNDIPRLKRYEEIVRGKSESIKNKRHEKARAISEAQKYAILTDKEKINMVIDNDMALLANQEKKINHITNN